MSHNIDYKNQSGNGDKPNWIFSFFRNILRLRPYSSLKESVEEVLEEYDDISSDSIDSGEKNLLRNVLSFSEMSIEDVMIPRADIIAVDHQITLKNLKETIETKVHTRLPVYRNTLDDIIGFIHIKDLVSMIGNNRRSFDITKIVRQALFVPPSMKTSVLLIKMQMSRVHMALVVDEHGGISGLVTLEDLVEEIVGEIEDEHDVVDDVKFSDIGDGSFEASAKLDIEELEQSLGISLRNDDDNFESIGGLIFSKLGRIPSIGEITTVASGNKIIEFEIIDADPRRIKRVLIRYSDDKNNEA